MNTKEQWIDNAMGSLDGASPAPLNPVVKETILRSIQYTGRGVESMTFSLFWKIAAAILLLISLNVFTIVYLNKSSDGRQNATKTAAREYFSYLNNYNL